MKNLTILLFLLIGITAIGQSVSLNRIPKSNPNNSPSLERKYKGVSVGVDIANAFIGGHKFDNGDRRNAQALDLIIRPMVGADWWEVGFPIEIFTQIDYVALGIDGNYVLPATRTMILLAGIGVDMVSRKGVAGLPENVTDGLISFSPSFSLRTRFEAILKTPMFLELQLKGIYRSDIKKIWGADALPSFQDSLAGYISAGYKF